LQKFQHTMDSSFHLGVRLSLNHLGVSLSLEIMKIKILGTEIVQLRKL